MLIHDYILDHQKNLKKASKNIENLTMMSHRHHDDIFLQPLLVVQGENKNH
jgi:hypothetical protein